MRVTAAALALAFALPWPARAQTPPTVFLEELTFQEVRDLIQAGFRNVIVATGGTEDNGPHMAIGKHNYIVAYAAERIARELGNTLVAPVIAYVPEGSWTPPTDHMQRPGTISLPDAEGYRELLAAAAISLKESGFRNVIFIGDSGGNQAGMKAVADELNGAWRGSTARILFVSDYYAKALADQEAYVRETLGIPAEQIGTHANIVDTSQLMFVRPDLVRADRLEPGSDTNGVSGDPRRATPQLGQALLKIKVDAAVAQVRKLVGSSAMSAATDAFEQVPAAAPLASVFLDELTWTEVRDRVAAGTTLAIVPTGGTEKNGFHMAMGKHNVLIRRGAEEMARKLGNALVAPVIQYVPEAQATEQAPGVLSCRGACFENVVAAAARSLRAGGFKDILLIGDNGGNQAGLRAVAERLNREWAGSQVRVFALTDYYEKGHEYLDSYLLAAYGWGPQTVGSHAGIADTSQLLYVRPESVRVGELAHSEQDRQASGASGDPTKATAELGRIALQLKANAGVAQYRALVAASEQDTAGGR